MAGGTITSANSTYVLAVASIFPVPVQLQDFGVDEAFDSEAVDAAETQIGVDGGSVGGWIPRLVPQTITFLATSLSCDLFDEWMAAQDAVQDIFYATGSIVLPGLGKQYYMSKGVIKRYPIIPNVKKVLANRVYTIDWLPSPGVPAIIVSPL